MLILEEVRKTFRCASLRDRSGERERERERDERGEAVASLLVCQSFAYREEHGWNTQLTPSSQFLEANVCIEGAWESVICYFRSLPCSWLRGFGNRPGRGSEATSLDILVSEMPDFHLVSMLGDSCSRLWWLFGFFPVLLCALWLCLPRIIVKALSFFLSFLKYVTKALPNELNIDTYTSRHITKPGG